jgi:hypothetical protein
MAGGSDDGSGPESDRPCSSTGMGGGCVTLVVEGAATGWGAIDVFGPTVRPPRSWGVYSVVSEGCGAAKFMFRKNRV